MNMGNSMKGEKLKFLHLMGFEPRVSKLCNVSHYTIRFLRQLHGTSNQINRLIMLTFIFSLTELSYLHFYFLFIFFLSFLMQVTLVMFATFLLSSPTHILTAEKIFTSLSLLNILRMPMTMLPFLIVASIQVLPLWDTV